MTREPLQRMKQAKACCKIKYRTLSYIEISGKQRIFRISLHSISICCLSEISMDALFFYMLTVATLNSGGPGQIKRVRINLAEVGHPAPMGSAQEVGLSGALGGPVGRWVNQEGCSPWVRGKSCRQHFHMLPFFGLDMHR